jgi:GGDEF domain-containing protein
LSLPQRLYREPIAPRISPRQHCQDAPNRFFRALPVSQFARRKQEMATINRQELDRLERRELQLTIMAAVFVFVLASGLAVFMYPLVFVHSDFGNKWTLRVAFFGFCALTLLFIGYLLERQRTVSKLKQQILEELERNIELRLQASADLLQTMPDINHFWDRLTMEYRRAMTMQKNLTLLLVRAKVGAASAASDNASALGDAAKAMSRKLRPTDSIYHLAPDLFGLVLPETDTISAKRIAVRLQEELQSVRSKHGGTFETSVHNYPENVQSSHELEDIVKSMLPVKDEYAASVPVPAKA